MSSVAETVTAEAAAEPPAANHFFFFARARTRARTRTSYQYAAPGQASACTVRAWLPPQLGRAHARASISARDISVAASCAVRRTCAHPPRPPARVEGSVAKLTACGSWGQELCG